MLVSSSIIINQTNGYSLLFKCIQEQILIFNSRKLTVPPPPQYFNKIKKLKCVGLHASQKAQLRSKLNPLCITLYMHDISLLGINLMFSRQFNLTRQPVTKLWKANSHKMFYITY